MGVRYIVTGFVCSSCGHTTPKLDQDARSIDAGPPNQYRSGQCAMCGFRFNNIGNHAKRVEHQMILEAEPKISRANTVKLTD